MKYLRFFIIAAAAGIVLLIAFQKADDSTNQIRVEAKINGVSFVAPVRPVEAAAMQPIVEINAGWVALTPFAFARAGEPELLYNHERQWWGEREEGMRATVRHAHQLGLKVMIKPHVWVRGQGWPGDFELSSEEAWEKWESHYRGYLMSYARIARELGVELLCIGTEYRKAAVQRPDFWRKLIDDIRSEYGGKLTYAANWDNYENIPFWDALDYIGVDAYFPLSEKQSPSVDELKTAWQPLKSKLKTYAGKKDRPVLFAEFGYESVDYPAAGHWKNKEITRGVNMDGQARAYQALFETFWDEPWFAGGFLWKWHEHPKRGGPDDKRYTPQNKPAEEIIREWYGRKSAHNE